MSDDAIGLAHSGHVTPAEGETFDPGEGDHSQSVILRDYYGRPLIFGDPQDELDGAALRRLREALPEGMWCMVMPDTRSILAAAEFGPDGGRIAMFVFTREDPKSQAVFGATIAEAADKCREALDR